FSEEVPGEDGGRGAARPDDRAGESPDEPDAAGGQTRGLGRWGGRTGGVGAARGGGGGLEGGDGGGGRGGGTKTQRRKREGGRFLCWEIVTPRGDEAQVLTAIAPTTIKFTIEVNHAIENGHHGIALFNHERQLIWATSVDHLRLERGTHNFRHTFPMLPLRP